MMIMKSFCNSRYHTFIFGFVHEHFKKHKRVSILYTQSKATAQPQRWLDMDTALLGLEYRDRDDELFELHTLMSHYFYM